MPRPTLKKRSDGRYRVKYKDKYFYGSTQSEAYAARDEYKRMLERGLKLDKDGMPVRTYAAKWVATYKAHVAHNTYVSHVLRLERFCNMYGDMRMNEITPTDIQSFVNQFAGMSQSNISKHIGTIKAMFKSALGDRVVAFDPTLNIVQPKGTKGTHRAISAEERALIQSSTHKLRAGAMVMLYAGLRRGEAMALDIDRDVDFEAGLIHVRKAVRFENGMPILVAPKTEAGTRVVPLLDILADELRGKHGLLIPGSDGNLIHFGAFNSAWRAFLTSLEVDANGCIERWYGRKRIHKKIIAEGGTLPPWKPVDIRPHDLRHSFCTLLYETGVDIKTAMKWMGHADHNMIMKIYAHLSAEQERASYKKLAAGVDAMVGGQNGGQTKHKKRKPVIK